ncbi:MAG: hypothetical protein HYY06_16740 [Deltaproteobacteria bacterium]|nr:hypothetical protein [Deltaproteobacteria bacterium]
MRTIPTTLLTMLAIAALGACGDDDAPVQTQPVAAAEGAPAPAAVPATPEPEPGANPDEADGGRPALPVWELTSNDFVEVEGQRRDPFRSYAKMFAEEGRIHPDIQVPVLLAQYSIDDLRLMAIVSGSGTPRAMVVDPTGLGTMIRRGDYVGRGEVVRGGADGSAEFEINWRVTKIRSEDVVLAREDPTSPGGTPVTRILPLHPEGSQSATPTSTLPPATTQ